MHDWGTRRMAYEIDHRPEAEYRLYQFNGDNDAARAAQPAPADHDAVLRFRIIKVKPGAADARRRRISRPPRRRDDREPQDTKVAARAAADAPAVDEALADAAPTDAPPADAAPVAVAEAAACRGAARRGTSGRGSGRGPAAGGGAARRRSAARRRRPVALQARRYVTPSPKTPHFSATSGRARPTPSDNGFAKEAAL